MCDANVYGTKDGICCDASRVGHIGSDCCTDDDCAGEEQCDNNQCSNICTITSGTVTLTSNLDCPTGLSISSGATLDTANYNVTVGDDAIIEGTFDLGASTITISDTMNLSGTIDADTSQITVGGDWHQQSGATFTYDTSTINFTKSGTTNIIMNAWFQVYNLNFADADGRDVTLSGTSNLVSRGTINMGTSSGSATLNYGGRTFYVQTDNLNINTYLTQTGGGS
jgi:hypothetical protein